MKRQIVVALSLLISGPLYAFVPVVAPSFTPSLQGGCFNPYGDEAIKARGKSFFSVRSPFGFNSPEFLAGFNFDRLDAAGKECRNGALQIVGLGGRSTDCCDLAKYFTPNGKQTLHIVEDDAVFGTDIIATQLGIYTVNEIYNGTPATLTGPGFESYVSFCPRYTFGGVGLSYKQEFAQTCDGRAFWFLISAPVLHVKTNMHLTERVVSDGGGVDAAIPGAVANATEAFSQDAWKFGKIFACNNGKTALGDLNVVVGYKALAREEYEMDTYVGLVAPTGNKVRGREMFEPIIGSNHHWGLIIGSTVNALLWESDCGRFDFAINTNGQYMFEACEVRSFDLKNKPWSRYMQVYANRAQAEQAAALPANDPVSVGLHTPGINIFTKSLRINPGYSLTSNSAFIYTKGCRQYELGYNFYARQAEHAELACPWKQTAALKSLVGNGRTDSVQLISNAYDFQNEVFVANYEQNVIRIEDLDLSVTEHPAVISSTIYANATHRFEHCNYPSFLGLGGSYEFSGDNTTMNRWMIWAKGGISF